jgi:anti-sigma28 factor (negative regulator of flagellin synthesis)
MSARAAKKESQGKKAHRSKHTVSPPQSRRTAELETRLEAMRDGEARIKRVEALQALVNANGYQVDSNALAEKIVSTPHMLRLLGVSPDHVDEFRLLDE